MKRLLDFIRTRSLRLVGRTDGLRYIYLETHGACTNRCYMCPGRAATKARPKMPEAMLRQMLEEIGESGFDGELHLYGQNEPLLDKRIFWHLDMAARLVPRAKIVLISNMTHMDSEKCRRLLDAPLDRLTVSLYATSRQEYLDICGKDNFDTVMRNAAEFAVQWARKRPYALSMDIIRSSRIRDWAKAREMLERMPVSWWKMPDLYTLRDIPEKGAETAWYYGDCLFDTLKIAGNGDITPCMADPNADLRFGNVADGGILETLNGRKARELRRGLYYSSGRGFPTFCRTCAFCRDHKLLYFLLPDGIRSRLMSRINSRCTLYGADQYRHNSVEDIERKAARLREELTAGVLEVPGVVLGRAEWKQAGGPA